MRFASEEFLDCKKWIAEKIESGNTWEQVKLFCVSEEDAHAAFDSLQNEELIIPQNMEYSDWAALIDERIQWPDGTEDVNVGIRHSVAFVGKMNRIVRDHAAIHELLLNKLPGNFQILHHGKLVLQGKIKAVRELGLGMSFGLFQRIPEFFAVSVFLRGEGREQDPGFDDAALAGVVAVFAVEIAVQFFSGPVRRGGDGRLPGAPFDLRHTEMKVSHSVLPPVRLSAGA